MKIFSCLIHGKVIDCPLFGKIKECGLCTLCEGAEEDDSTSRITEEGI